MGALSTLNPFESKEEEKPRFFPNMQIGGSMELFDGWGEELGEKSGQVVAEAASTVTESVVDLFNQVTESKDEAKKTSIGGKTELKFNQKQSEEDKLKEKMRVAEHQKKLSDQQKEAMAKEVRKKAIAKQRENVIRTIGGISNTSYEDVMDENGQMRVDIEAWFNKKNSEMQLAELKKQKQNQVAQATNQVMGENELLKGGENQNHFTKAVG